MNVLWTCLLLVTTSLASATSSESLPFVGGMPGRLEQSVTVGDLAYCASSSGLLVLDVADPAAIEQVAWLPMPNGLWWAAVEIDGRREDGLLLVVGVGAEESPCILVQTNK